MSNCANTSVGLTPSTYVRSSGRETAGLTAGAGVVARDASGAPDVNGLIGIVGIGSSLCRDVVTKLRQIYLNQTPTKNHKVRWVNGGFSGRHAPDWADPGSDVWTNLDTQIAGQGLTDEQVQMVHTIVRAGEGGAFSAAILDDIHDLLVAKFANLKVIYWSCSAYAGYTDPGYMEEPDVHDNTILMADYVEDTPPSTWSDYFDLWSDGVNANPLTAVVGVHASAYAALSYDCADYVSDGTHPSESGREKQAQSLLNRWAVDPVIASVLFIEEADTVMGHSLVTIGPIPDPDRATTPAAITGSRIDDNAEQHATRFYAQTNLPVTHVQMKLDITGTGSGSIQWAIEIQSDNGSDQPSGTVLGAATASFVQAADGWTGQRELATPTPALTIGQPYWIVWYRTGGTSLTASVYGAWMRQSNVDDALQRTRIFTGGNWNTISSGTPLTQVITYSDGTHQGNVWNAALTGVGVTEIYGANKQGLRFRLGMRAVLRGFIWQAGTLGTPGDLRVTIYRGATSLMTWVLPIESFSQSTNHTFILPTPLTLLPGQDHFIVFSQDGSAGDSSNFYRFRGAPLDATMGDFIDCHLPDRWRVVYGNGSDPTAFTVVTTFVPVMSLLVEDLVADLLAGGTPIRAGRGGLV